MATPIIEQIAALVKTQLETITTANGYELDVLKVIRPPRAMDISDYSLDNNVAYVQQAEPSLGESDEMAGNPPIKEWVQPFVIDWIIRVSEKDETPVDQLLNTARSDIEKAMAAGLEPDTDLDDLVTNWSIREPQFAQYEDGFELVRVTIDITYRVSETDPYTSRA